VSVRGREPLRLRAASHFAGALVTGISDLTLEQHRGAGSTAGRRQAHEGPVSGRRDIASCPAAGVRLCPELLAPGERVPAVSRSTHPPGVRAGPQCPRSRRLGSPARSGGRWPFTRTACMLTGSLCVAAAVLPPVSSHDELFPRQLPPGVAATSHNPFLTAALETPGGCKTSCWSRCLGRRPEPGSGAASPRPARAHRRWPSIAPSWTRSPPALDLPLVAAG
jgi:hypothetical protein